MEKARCNTELYSNLRGPLNNVKPSNFWGSHHGHPLDYMSTLAFNVYFSAVLGAENVILSEGFAPSAPGPLRTPL